MDLKTLEVRVNLMLILMIVVVFDLGVLGLIIHHILF